MISDFPTTEAPATPKKGSPDGVLPKKKYVFSEEQKKIRYKRAVEWRRRNPLTPEQKARALATSTAWQKRNKERVRQIKRAFRLRRGVRLRPELTPSLVHIRAIIRRVKNRLRDKYATDAQKEKRRAQARIRYANRSEEKRLLDSRADREYREKNRLSIGLKRKIGISQNRSKYNAIAAARRALKKSREHAGADPSVMLSFYTEAKRLSKESGILHEVDHCIAIASGGWHHESNLQVLPWFVNLSKGRNPFWMHERFMDWRDVPRYLWPDALRAEYERLILIHPK